MFWLWGVGFAAAQDAPAGTDTNLANATQNTNASGLSSDQIHTVVAEHRLEVRSCVSGEGLNLPIRLEVVVDFLIGSDGHVVRASMFESNTGNADVDACVLEAVRSFEFPEPGRDFPVRYPFMFVTGG